MLCEITTKVNVWWTMIGVYVFVCVYERFKVRYDLH